MVLAVISVVKVAKANGRKNKPKVHIGRVTLKAKDGNRVEIVVGGLDAVQTAQVTNQIRHWFKETRTNAGVDWERFEENKAVFDKVLDTLERSMDRFFDGVFK